MTTDSNPGMGSGGGSGSGSTPHRWRWSSILRDPGPGAGPYRQAVPRDVVNVAPEWASSEPDVGTRCRAPSLVQMMRPRPPSFEALFHLAYASIRQTCSGKPSPGVAVVAVDGSRREVAGSLWRSAVGDGDRAIVVGRHHLADLALDGDYSLSLRHLLLFVGSVETTARGPSRPSVTLIDLRSRAGVQDEEGTRREAMRSDGPMFVQCGPLALFVFPTATGERWPSSAEPAWAGLPARVLVGPQPPSVLAPVAVRRVRIPGTSDILSLLGPVGCTDALIHAGETRQATLTIESPWGFERAAVGGAALDRGVLLGRYDRCDGSALLRSDAVSRTHLLIIRVNDAVFAIDLRSSNGTWVLSNASSIGTEMCVIRLDGPRLIGLSGEPVLVHWQPVH